MGAEQRKDVIAERSLGPGHPGGESVAVGKSWPPKKHLVEHGFKLLNAQRKLLSF